MNKKIVHDALVLTAFTLILGFVLGAVHEITKDRILAAELAAEQAAYREVFADAADFPDYEADLESLNTLVAGEGYQDTIKGVKEAVDASGGTLGYVVNVTANDGSQGSITFSVGIQNDGTVNGYAITDISETPGLGDKATQEGFYSQFQNKLVELFQVVKSAASSEEEIEAITGATITSRAMANGVNAALVVFRELAGGVN